MGKRELYQRINNFVSYVRDPSIHHKFKPGSAWWLLYKSKNSTVKYPDALTLSEQLMIPLSDFQRCLGNTWNKNLEVLFPDFRFNRYNSVIFLTVNVALENDGYGTSVSHPTTSTIIDKVSDRISYERLQMDVLPEQPWTVFDIDLFLSLKDQKIGAENKELHKNSDGGMLTNVTEKMATETAT